MNCEPIKNSEIPVIVFTKKSWTIVNILPYLKDNQEIVLNNYSKPIKIKNHFIVLVGDEDIQTPDGYMLVSQFHCQRFEGYELKKAE